MNHDEHEFQILSKYLAQLQAGERPDREAFLREHPELASALDCLEALEKLGPKPGEMKDEGFILSSDIHQAAGDLPRAFGGYQLISEIGRGGMGVVYKARQEDLDRVVAVKMILASHLASPEQVRRFQAEARAAAKLRHSHIVPIHEVGQCNGQDYFTMEYIEGQSLAQRIQGEKGTGLICRNGPKGAMHKLAPSPFPPAIDIPTAVRIVSSIARAVEYLHRQGIVHRDLKPSNILLDTQGEPYLTDFGLAKILAPDVQLTATGVIAGTPAYMAPEQAAGRSREVGPATDIYSLGAILYELLTGQPPFMEENPLDTLLNVLSVDPTLPRRLNPKIPRELELICLTCLQKLPGERYASAEALADDLDRFARGEPIKVRPPHLGQRFLGWTRRQPALATRLGGLALFYAIECMNFLTGNVVGVDWDFHKNISIVIGIWAVVSIICQRFLESRRWSLAAPFIWGTLDSICLFVVLLFIADGAASPLIVGYPLVIVASGLWFRVRFVWFMTALSLLSYGVLVIDFYRWRPELHAPNYSGVDRHVIFVVSLILLAAIVAYLVKRVRTLSSFYGQRT